MSVALATFAGTTVAAHGQHGEWAAADNAAAKFMVDGERQWAETACNHNKIAAQAWSAALPLGSQSGLLQGFSFMSR